MQKTLITDLAFEFETLESSAPVRGRGAIDNASDNRRFSDFDGDGVADILLFNYQTGALGGFLMPNAEWSYQGIRGDGWVVAGHGYFDNDVGNGADLGWVNVVTFEFAVMEITDLEESSFNVVGTAGTGWIPLVAGDLDGNGRTDWLAWNMDASKIGMYLTQDDGSVSWRGLGSYGADWELMHFGDYNNDGVDDLLWFNESTNGIGQYEMSASGRTWKSITKMGANWEVAGSGDFNDDGYDDILVANFFTNKLGIFDMNGGTPTWLGLGGFGSDWYVTGIADLDGSGTDDILWRNEDGRLGMYKMDGTSRVWESLPATDTEWDIVL